MSEFSHVNRQGQANMVDVSDKTPLKREAKARGFITLNHETVGLIRDNQLKKGDVLTVARIAGIQAAKQTPHLIPLCHTLLLNKVNIETILQDDGVAVTSTVICVGQTGVEMEALTAVSVALLTIYDMCKAVDKNMVIKEISLLEKTKQPLE